MAITPEAQNLLSGDSYFVVNTGGVYLGLPKDAHKAGEILAQTWGMKKLFIEMAHDNRPDFNPNSKTDRKVNAERIAAFAEAGVLAVGFWSFVTGNKPVETAKLAVEITKGLLDSDKNGIVRPVIGLDVETAYDKSGTGPFIQTVDQIRTLCPEATLVGISWAKPLLHNRKLMAEVAWGCDVVMPMAYWPGNNPATATAYLDVTRKQWEVIHPGIGPNLLMAGRVYYGDGGYPGRAATLVARENAMQHGEIGMAQFDSDWPIRWGVTEKYKKAYGMTPDFFTGLPEWTTVIQTNP